MYLEMSLVQLHALFSSSSSSSLLSLLFSTQICDLFISSAGAVGICVCEIRPGGCFHQSPRGALLQSLL